MYIKNSTDKGKEFLGRRVIHNFFTFLNLKQIFTSSPLPPQLDIYCFLIAFIFFRAAGQHFLHSHLSENSTSGPGRDLFAHLCMYGFFAQVPEHGAVKQVQDLFSCACVDALLHICTCIKNSCTGGEGQSYIQGDWSSSLGFFVNTCIWKMHNEIQGLDKNTETPG